MTLTGKNWILAYMIKHLKRRLKPEYLSFGIIGLSGFIIDSGLFTLLHYHFSYVVSRTISISIATICSWLANRTYTFKYDKKISSNEWLKYAATYSLGAGINLTIFERLCHLSPLLNKYYLIPIMFATGVSMISNFSLSKYYVFR